MTKTNWIILALLAVAGTAFGALYADYTKNNHVDFLAAIVLVAPMAAGGVFYRRWLRRMNEREKSKREAAKHIRRFRHTP